MSILQHRNIIASACCCILSTTAVSSRRLAPIILEGRQSFVSTSSTTPRPPLPAVSTGTGTSTRTLLGFVTTATMSSPESKKQRRDINLSSTATPLPSARSDTSTNSNNDHNDHVELLSAWFCPYAQRAWIALNEKAGIGNFRVTEAMETVGPDEHYEKIPKLLESNPNGLVPVIIDRRGARNNVDNEGDSSQDNENIAPTIIVYESLVCVEYADEALGSTPGTLLPGPPGQRAEARMWADKLNKQVSTSFYRLLIKQTKEEQDKAADVILSALRDFSCHCREPYFFGDEFTLVDIALAPWAVGIRMDVLRHYRNFEIPMNEEYERYHAWAKAISQRPSFKATACTDLPAMIGIYRRYAEGTALSKVGDAVRGGSAMP
mmetsp:Transcript_14467/g.32260  ORF Transcript_14467/g.32260 Transcript_14467/m.32260 type:complete len:378 (+) Transcript_14467:153-1286(+)